MIAPTRMIIALALVLTCASASSSSVEFTKNAGNDNVNGSVGKIAVPGGKSRGLKDHQQQQEHEPAREAAVGLRRAGHTDRDLEVNEDDFEVYKTDRTCRIYDGEKGEDTYDYIIVKHYDHGTCHDVCLRQTWCMGYEFNPGHCELWSTEPKSTRYKKGSICAYDD